MIMIDEASNEVPEVFLLVENTRKGSNFGPFLRCASAFGIRTIVVVGYDRVSAEGAHGANKHVRLIPFTVLDNAISFLRNECRCTDIVGLLGAAPLAYSADGYDVVEDVATQLIRPSQQVGDDAASPRRSFPVSGFPFRPGNMCIAFGRQALGLSSTLAKGCQRFIHVPHKAVAVSSNAEDSQTITFAPLLDAQSCLSIVLHHFTQWAQYDEHTFCGHKFEVDTLGQVVEQESQQQQHDSRQRQKIDHEADVEAVMDGGLDGLFDFA